MVPSRSAFAAQPLSGGDRPAELRAEWSLLAALPQRLVHAWLEAHLRILETTLTMIDRQVAELDASLHRTLDLCAVLVREDDPLARMRAQIDHAGQDLRAAVAAAHGRYDLVSSQQAQGLAALGREAQAAMRALDAARAVAGRPSAARRSVRGAGRPSCSSEHAAVETSE